MNPLRYITRRMLREKDRTTDGAFNTPFEAFLISARIRPLYESSTKAGPSLRGISEDNITVFSFYPSRNLMSVSTRFTDGTSIVSFDNKFTKTHTLFLKIQPELSQTWRIHREEVEKRIQNVSALDRGTVEQHVAYEDYWSSFLSSILLPVFMISQILFVVILIFSAFYLR